jgi:Bacterial Ig-like domain (group 2)
VWESSDWAVATVDGELNMITTHAPGTVSVTAVCKDSGLKSNAVTIEVLDITGVDLSPLEMELRAGSRQPITASVMTRDGRAIQGLYLIWTEDNPEIVSVGSGGMVFGLTVGETNVAAGDNQALSVTPTRVRVLERGETGKDGGSGFPRILLSEIDDDPLGERPPVFSEAEPPVYQRVQDVDHNIWWINMASPLARRYIDTARGGGWNSREWRVYHLERYIEVMVKILLTYDFTHGQDLSFETMLRRWEEESIAMQQRAIASLHGFLEGGEALEAA